MSSDAQGSFHRTSFALSYFRIAAVSVILTILFVLIFHALTKGFLQSIETARQTSLSQLVRVARNSVEPTVEKVRNGQLSKEEGLRDIRNIVRRMVYKDQYGKNYIFMSAY